MFFICKGVSSENVNEEIKKALKYFQNADIQDMLTKIISASKIRKLSISIYIYILKYEQ